MCHIIWIFTGFFYHFINMLKLRIKSSKQLFMLIFIENVAVF